jgi:hypothetical protein
MKKTLSVLFGQNKKCFEKLHFIRMIKEPTGKEEKDVLGFLNYSRLYSIGDVGFFKDNEDTHRILDTIKEYIQVQQVESTHLDFHGSNDSLTFLNAVESLKWEMSESDCLDGNELFSTLSPQEVGESEVEELTNVTTDQVLEFWRSEIEGSTEVTEE